MRALLPLPLPSPLAADEPVEGGMIKLSASHARGRPWHSSVMLRFDDSLALGGRCRLLAWLGTGDCDPLPDDEVADPDADPELERGSDDTNGIGEGANGVTDPETVLVEIDGEIERGRPPFSELGDM